VKGNNHVLEKDYMLISEWDGKAGNDASQNIQELGGTIEFVCFVDQ